MKRGLGKIILASVLCTLFVAVILFFSFFSNLFQASFFEKGLQLSPGMKQVANSLSNSISNVATKVGEVIPSKVCEENWQCSEWSICDNGKQTRICRDENSCGSEKNKPEIERNCEAEATLTVEDLAKIKDAQGTLQESFGHDYSKIYDMIEKEKGNVLKIFKICDEFGELIFCLRWASKENPEFRKEICDKLFLDIQEKYGNRANPNAHKQECLVGMPQYAR